MRRIILLSTVFFLSVISFAQSNAGTTGKKYKPAHAQSIESAKTNGVIMKNGTMLWLKKGRSTKMTSELTCDNGTKVSVSGTVTKKDGTQFRLKEGQYMDVCGKVMTIKNSKSGNDKNMYLVPDSKLEK